MASHDQKKANIVDQSLDQEQDLGLEEGWLPSNSEMLELLAAQPPDPGAFPGSPSGWPATPPAGLGDLGGVADLALPDWARDLDDAAADAAVTGLDAGWGVLVDLSQDAQTDVSDVADSAWGGAQTAGHAVTDGLSGARDAVVGKSADLADQAHRGLDTAADMATDIGDAAWGRAKDLGDTAADTAEGIGHAAWDGANDLGHAAWDGAKEVGATVLDTAGIALTAMEWRGSWDVGGKDGDAPAVQADIRAKTAEIPNQDIIYEQLAHGAAYGKFNQAQLFEWGYMPLIHVVRQNNSTGVAVVAVVPRKCLPAEQALLVRMHGRALRPVVAFRGSADAVNWKDDASIQRVGAAAFAAHQDEFQCHIASLAGASADGKVDLVGHSLGGALAQMAATLGNAGRIVTFQAPGIGAEMVDQIPDDVTSTHHRARNDVVPWAGGAHSEGRTYEYDQEGLDTPLYSHTYHLLPGVNALRGDGQQGNAVPMVYDTSVFTEPSPGGSAFNGKQDHFQAAPIVDVSDGVADWSRDGETDAIEQAWVDARDTTAELGRTAAGYAMLGEDNLHDGFAAVGDSKAMPVLDLVSPNLAATARMASNTPSVSDAFTNVMGVYGSGGVAGDQNPRDLDRLAQVRVLLNQAVADGRSKPERIALVKSSGLPHDFEAVLVDQITRFQK
jgi:hypothetical protein